MARTHIRRLDRIWVTQPVCFITTCTLDRRKELATREFHKICREVWRNAEDLYGWKTGKNVVMPDHVHFFCLPTRDEHLLQTFVGKWKEWTAKYSHRRHSVSAPLWQPEFFDHVLRSSESYEQKWEYVRQNPVRAGLIVEADDWQYQGEMNEFRY